MVVRQSDGDRHADGLSGVMYRWSGSDKWSNRLCGLSYRWSGIDGQSDRLISGLMGGVADRQVIDELTGWWMYGTYDVQMGMTDGLAMVCDRILTYGTLLDVLW